MAEWADVVYAARRRGDETTRESVFVYTNSNNTRGILSSGTWNAECHALHD